MNANIAAYRSGYLCCSLDLTISHRYYFFRALLHHSSFVLQLFVDCFLNLINNFRSLNVFRLILRFLK